MKKILLLLLISTLVLSGCDFRNKKYSGKVFNISVEVWEGGKSQVQIWKNANKVTYDSEENAYSFYVDGKLIVLDNYSSVTLAEIGATPSVSAESEQYLGKRFDISILNNKEIVKTWKNTEVKSADSERIQFLFDNQVMYVIPSMNESIIIEEAK